MYSFGLFSNLVRTPLLTELQPFLDGSVLRHPILHFDYVDPRLYSRLNQLYERRRDGNARPRKNLNDWERLRPNLTAMDRLRWFLQSVVWEREAIPKRYTNIPDRYHQIIGHLWTDPEILANTSDALRLLLRMPQPSQPIESLMVESERRRLFELPSVLQVFRGHQGIEHGVSWTLNPSVALNWAFRVEPDVVKQWNEAYPDTPRYPIPLVTVGTVQKSQVVAYVSRRGEDEILVNPDYVRDRQSYDVIRD